MTRSPPQRRDGFDPLAAYRLKTSQSAITAADRHERWKKVHPRFKEWCAQERPQVKCSLENWDDARIKGRFFGWLSEQPSEPPQAPAPAPLASEAPEPVLDPNAPHPPDFKDYIAQHTPSKKPSGKVLARYWQDETTRGLFALWRKEQAATRAKR